MDEDIPPAHAASSSAAGAQHPTATATASSLSSSSSGSQPGTATATATGNTSNGSSAPIPPSSGFAVSLNAGSASGSNTGGGSAASRPMVSNLERAKVTSPTYERSNPLSMRVAARPGAGAGAGIMTGGSSRSRRGPSAEGAAAAGTADVQRQPEGNSGSTSTSTSTAKGKGPAAASEQDTAMVPVVEPKEAIRQQFHVRGAATIHLLSGTVHPRPASVADILCPGTFACASRPSAPTSGPSIPSSAIVSLLNSWLGTSLGFLASQPGTGSTAEHTV